MNEHKKRLARTTRPASRRRDGAARPRPVDPELHSRRRSPVCGVVHAEPAQPAMMDASFSTAQPLSARTANPLGVRPVTERHPGDRFDT
jgi:hypothetical protein